MKKQLASVFVVATLVSASAFAEPPAAPQCSPTDAIVLNNLYMHEVAERRDGTLSDAKVNAALNAKVGELQRQVTGLQKQLDDARKPAEAPKP